MKNLIALVVLCAITQAHAGYNRMSQDLILPTQKMLEYQVITNPGAAYGASLFNNNQGATSGSSVSVTSFLEQPDVARNLTFQAVSNASNVQAGSIVISGKDMYGRSISEALDVLSNQSTVITGSKAFKTVDSVSLPGEDLTFIAEWDGGFGDKLGLAGCLDTDEFVIKSWINTTAETVAFSVDASALESNTALPSNLANGSRDYEFLYVQNFRCSP